MLINQLLDNQSNEAIAFSYRGLSITYKTFKDNTKKVRAYYHTMGIKKGDHVGLYCKNSPEFIYAYFAIVSMGAVVVPLNSALTSREVAYIAKDAKMRHIATSKKLDLPGTYKQLLISDYTQTIASIQALEDQRSEVMDPDDVSVIIYTSGTTGNPKGAMLSHKNLISNVEGFVNALEVTAQDKILCVLPMFHSFAWTTTVLTSIYCGATVVIMQKFNPNEVLKTIRNERVTIVCGVPAMYTYYLTKGTQALFKSLRIFVSGGASLPMEITEQFKKKFGLSIVEGYGLSEASPVVTVNPLNDVRVGSIGRPLSNVEVKIVNSLREEIVNGQVGELIVRGPNIMQGYYNLPEVTDQTIIDHWLYTGDMAYMNDEGYVYIVDRLKDIILVSGMNVYPREIEEVIYKYEGILEAAVFGIAEKVRGEIPVAYIVVKDARTFDIRSFKNYLKENLAPFKLPRQIITLKTLPKNATGKIMKKTLKAQHTT